MNTLVSCLLAFIGCGLLFQATPKRATIDHHFQQNLSSKKYYPIVCRLLGLVFLLGSIYFACAPQGIERGIAIWLGIVSACGFLGLFLSAWNQRFHLPSIAISAIVLIPALLLI